jgi:hypothetical protein
VRHAGRDCLEDSVVLYCLVVREAASEVRGHAQRFDCRSDLVWLVDLLLGEYVEEAAIAFSVVLILAPPDDLAY